MIVTVCLNPAVNKTVTVEHLTVGGVNRVLASRQDPGGKVIRKWMNRVVMERLV